MSNSIATINLIPNSRAGYAYAETGTPSQKAAEQTNITETSTVTLSEQGKLAAKIGMDSLGSYRVPDWMMDFIPEQNMLNSADAIKETRAHIQMREKMSADGEFSVADRQFMMNQLANHSPATREYHANAEFRMRFKDELTEYAGILRNAYDQAKQENGIATRDDYINKVLNAPDDNHALRDSLAEKLLDNPEALDLMNKLGIARPSVQRT